MFCTVCCMEPQTTQIQAKLCKMFVFTVKEQNVMFHWQLTPQTIKKMPRKKKKHCFSKWHLNDANKKIQEVCYFEIKLNAFMNCHGLAIVKSCQIVCILNRMHGQTFNVALYVFMFTLSPAFILQFSLILKFLIGFSNK